MIKKKNLLQKLRDLLCIGAQRVLCYFSFWISRKILLFGIRKQLPKIRLPMLKGLMEID
jgi:hypothetical protein